jgi:tetratricopeptide (TPR) repeat protein/CHAT domain-containing protein
MRLLFGRCLRFALLVLVVTMMASRGGAATRHEKPATEEDRETLVKRGAAFHAKAAGLEGENKHEQALVFGRQALAIRERLYPAKDYPNGHLDLAATLNVVGESLEGLGEPRRALAYYERALAMRERLYPESRFKDGHEDIATSLTNVADALWATDEPRKALPYYERALAMRERLYPEFRFKGGHTKLSASLTNMGLVLEDLGELARALPYHERALAMDQRLYPKSRFKDGHADLATSLANLANLLKKIGEPGKALPYYERALVMRERLYPESRFKDGHDDLAASLRNMGHVLKEMGEPAKALPYYERALAMLEKLYPESRFRDGHADIATSLNSLGHTLDAMGDPAKALPYFERALAMCQRLYPEARFKDGHADIATTLNNLGHTLRLAGEPTKALPYLERALAMCQRLYPESRFKDGHADIATTLNNLGRLLVTLGEPVKALRYHERALAMCQRLYPESRFRDGHHDIAASLNLLGYALDEAGEPAKARPYLEKALAMGQRLYPEARFKDGHLTITTSLNHLAHVLQEMGEHKKAVQYLEKALAMRQRLYGDSRSPSGHYALAYSLNNLAFALQRIGEPARALEYYEQALAMKQGLYPQARFKDGHPDLAEGLHSLGHVQLALRDPRKSLEHFEKAMAMQRRLSEREVAAAPEARALNYLRSLPRTRDGYLNAALLLPAAASSCYDPVYASRSSFLRLMLRRHESARAALLESPDAREKWRLLGDVRRRVSRLIVEPGTDLAAHDRLLAKLEDDQAKLESEMVKLLPEIEEQRQVAKTGPEDLASKLPARSAFVDIVSYADSGQSKGGGWRYLAFVLPAGKAARTVNLGDAVAINQAVRSWRRSIQAGESSGAPVLLRKLVWEPIERALPDGTATVYLSLDDELARLPFAALPGRGKGTVLLEDYILATAPAGAWLLQQLRKATGKDDGSVLALGDVAFGAAATGRPAFLPLKETDTELSRILEAFTAKADAALRGDKATAMALRRRLPEARVAHLATHAYYDVDALNKEYGRIRKLRESWTPSHSGTERVGLGARNPLAFVGLVLAGGNDPSKAVDGGILTGLEILELPLEKMHLCVLSACETGLGRWDELAGVSGLQLAFHVAGCRNVVGSLWNVNDAATAALMTQFYHELRVNKKTPLEALRTAQLTIYHHPERIADLAGDRGRPALEKAAALGTRAPAPAAKGKKADTKLWAAFVLSGPGN